MPHFLPGGLSGALRRIVCTLLMLGASAGALAADPVFHIRIYKQHFSPDELKVPAHVRFQVVVRNDDDAPNEFDSYELNRERHVLPHSEAVLYLGPLAPGRYAFKGEERVIAQHAAAVVCDSDQTPAAALDIDAD